MITIANAQFWVRDQDEALAFYTQTLGWEVRADVTMAAWNFRWLCVGPEGQDDVGLVLMPVPGPPMLDLDSSGVLAELVAKGAGGTLFLETDDCEASYAALSARGVVFNDPPTVQPYGIDTSFRDPSGNNIRLTQVLEFDPHRVGSPG
jgi:predicted enzyme related to lactoylglutathione lyase